ncbi:hypothetical protein [Streptomyces olivochromogenes]|uniref:hypothetical protein n=1 Tax=Streptomyces olivochromogenes TaxID=1963 RepID=UPI001F2D911C|nr:hypothetical protein [Streptomyces olivochromogenes]MCF3132458.1 hypothetical protein [Streptomyces olivochromogenes]
MNSSNDPNYSPLRDVAQSPEATARYLADIQRVLLDIGSNLEVLARETRVHLRETHVEGDRWYHARLRAQPVEKALKNVLRHLNGLTGGLEKAAYKRNIFTDEVKALPQKRKERELEKQRKKNPQLQAAQNSMQQQGEHQASNQGHTVPASIYDLGRNRESA